MQESSILLIADDPIVIDTVGRVIQSVGTSNLSIMSGIEASSALESGDGTALVVIHLKERGPAPEVARLLQMISTSRRPIATLVIARHHDPEQELELLRLGVADYLGWPPDLTRLSYLVDVLTIRGRRAESGSAVESPRPILPDSIFDDGTPETEHLMDLVRRVAPLDTPVLLGGETGTGKARLARLIHELSNRRAETFLTIECGSLSARMVESEIFGHVRGSFPGAESDRPGKLTEAGGGTLFFHEIGTLPMAAQSKLLRAIEDRVFEPAGSIRPRPVRARVIAANCGPLDQEVGAHRFRSDLYYRLNVIGLQLAPLRERRDAISPLALKFLAESAGRVGRKVDAISDEALRALREHDWPGNLRELRTLIDQAVSLCPGNVVRREDLPETITRAGSRTKRKHDPANPAVGLATIPRSTLAEIKWDAELARITEALEKHGNNRLRAASELGISRMTLYKKLYKYGLMQPQTHARAASPGGVA